MDERREGLLIRFNRKEGRREGKERFRRYKRMEGDKRRRERVGIK